MTAPEPLAGYRPESSHGAQDVIVTLRPGQRLIVRYEAQQSPMASVTTTLEELAPLLSTSVRALRRLVKQGKLPAVRHGRAYVVLRADADRLLRPNVAPAIDSDEASPRERERRQLEAAGIKVA